MDARMARRTWGNYPGMKCAGSGREGGRWSLEEMTEVKWVTIQMGKRQ